MSPIRNLLLALGLSAGLVAAKGADDYLHGGASLYIQSRLQEASVEVEEGLRKFPHDTRLKALADQLKSMKDQQKQDQGGGGGQGGEGDKQKQNKQDSSQDQKGQGKQDQKQDKQKQDQQQKDQDKDKQGGDKDKDKDKDQNGQANNPPPQAQPGKEGDSTGKGAAPVPPGQMSKEEAERLLNSYQDDEKREQKNMQRRSRKPVEVEEDW